MDMTMHLSRTLKGQEEIFNHGHTLRPKQRQILFSVGNGISLGELRAKLPNCTELETMVSDLLQSGFIQALRNMAGAPAAPAAAPPPPAPAPVAAAAPPPTQPPGNLGRAPRSLLDFLAAPVGAQAP